MEEKKRAQVPGISLQANPSKAPQKDSELEVRNPADIPLLPLNSTPVSNEPKKSNSVGKTESNENNQIGQNLDVVDENKGHEADPPKSNADKEVILNDNPDVAVKVPVTSSPLSKPNGLSSSPSCTGHKFPIETTKLSDGSVSYSAQVGIWLVLE